MKTLRWMPNPRARRGLTLALLAALAACGDDPVTPDNNNGTPPDLPPLTSMTGDFSIFGAPGGGEAVGPNFTNAALRVIAAQVVTVVALAVPVATFAAAANNTPTFEADGLWHWRFTAVHLGQTHTAHLSGSVQGSDVVWTMEITSPSHVPPLEDFVWFGGQGRVDRTSGTWTFYDPSMPSTSTALLRIDWTHVSATEHGWTATALGGDGVGDVFTADVDGDDHLITYMDASEQTTVEIYWNAADGSGYIIAPNYNGGLKACWDFNQDDVVCP